jgi:small multidrug resistance family-3 protein
MKPIFYFCLAAFFEIAGCFAIWQWLRRSESILLLPLGIVSLLIFAFTLTRVDVTFAGRGYAAYGGIYVVASLACSNRDD